MIELRQATIQDLDEVVELEKYFPKNIRISRQAIARSLRSPSTEILVAENFWRIVGSVIIRYRINSEVAHIDSLVVAPRYRKQGIARQLKLMATKYAYARGATKLRSEVAVNNRKMIKLNESLDWVKDGVIYNYYGKGKHAYCMVKD